MLKMEFLSTRPKRLKKWKSFTKTTANV